VQQLNALESLASVDLVCLDKTGTLTDSEPHVVAVIASPEGDRVELEAALARYSASARSRTSTLDAIARAFPGREEAPVAEVPFSSARRFSALRLNDATYVMGAPELFPLGPLAAKAEEEARRGRRVLALATSDQELPEREEEWTLPAGLKLLGLVVVGERLRAEARDAVAYLLDQGVDLIVLSGDRPETAAFIADQAGIPLRGAPLDGRELPRRDRDLLEAIFSSSVVGRISPEGKRRVVEALASAGRYVAMVGDGVNDVPALKAARLAIAQGTGSQMARSVADLVLVEGDFASLPDMVAEGRKILRNLTRVAKLFVTKSAFAGFLIVSIGLSKVAYPLLPRHLTLAASLTIGIPGFFLALAPSTGPFRVKGFLRDVIGFALPAGTAAGLGVLSSYTFVSQVLDRPLVESRTVATTVLVAVGLYLILAIEASSPLRGAAVSLLCGLLASAYVAVLLIPLSRQFFALAIPDPAALAAALGGAVIAIAGLAATDERFLPGGSARA
ncbi:MAG: hypothetical protein C4305_05475, partial [Thermoleophilia bacterium]